jgi:hypothetical protein
MALGIWLIGISANYTPPSNYLALIASWQPVQAEGEPEIGQAKRQGNQPAMILSRSW